MRRHRGIRSEATDDLVPEELVERCKRGDQDAWRSLVEATHREVYTLCLRILRDPDDAAEAAQDTYVKAWRGLKGFRGDAQVSTWLYRIASNTAISKHRSRKRTRDYETRAGDEVLEQLRSDDRSTEAAAEARLDLAVVEAALVRLPEHYRTVILLRDVYGLSMEEVAARLKISVTAAKVRVHRGRKKLRELAFDTSQDATGSG